jgi:lincosamide nucleotidyltransferase A/C/D/E
VANHESEGPSLSAHDAVALYTAFAEGGIRCWVMGGWGVDALLGVETRPHHDLDLLVAVEDLADFLDLLADRGFSQKLIWQAENRWIDVRGGQRPTAFVQMDDAGREVDVHVVDFPDAGPPIALCEVPWLFDHHSLMAVGLIAGTQVRCVSAETQLQMHSGYDLPPQHERDVERLRRSIEAFGDHA